jgi:hypothetical protein
VRDAPLRVAMAAARSVRLGAAFLRRGAAFFFLDVFIFRLLALLLLFVFFRFLAMNASRLNSRRILM